MNKDKYLHLFDGRQIKKTKYPHLCVQENVGRDSRIRKIDHRLSFGE